MPFFKRKTKREKLLNDIEELEIFLEQVNKIGFEKYLALRTNLLERERLENSIRRLKQELEELQDGD